MSAGQPPRLERIFQIYDPPLYFVTFCTGRRRKVLANEAVHHAVIEYGRRGEERNVGLGRYVIMPDHVHLFVRGSHEFDLGIWVRGLKRAIAAAVTGVQDAGVAMESAQNPVRAELVTRAENWPFAGEIVYIDRV